MRICPLFEDYKVEVKTVKTFIYLKRKLLTIILAPTLELSNYHNLN